MHIRKKRGKVYGNPAHVQVSLEDLLRIFIFLKVNIDDALVVAAGEFQDTGCLADLTHSLDNQGLLFAPRDLPIFKFFKDFSLEHVPKLHFSDRIVNTLSHFFKRISVL